MSLQLEKKFNAESIASVNAQIEGYASIFGKADQQGDAVEKGAFADSLKERGLTNIKMLWQHDPAQPIGVWTLLEEDGYGLRVEGHILQDLQMGKEALTLIEAGAVKGLSIGYRTLQSLKSNTGGRILRKVDLWEISLVTFPMLTEAEANLKKESRAELMAQACQELLATMKETTL